MGEYLRNWLAEYVKVNNAPRTWEGRAHRIERHIIPALGRLPLTSLKPDHLQRFYAEKLSGGRIDGKGGLSGATVSAMHLTVHAALETAVRRGLLVRNVADAVDPPHVERPEMHTLNEAGLNAVLEAARRTPYFALFYVHLFTGVRRSEALALRWCDVDLALGHVYTNRAMHRLRTGEIIFRAPKSAHGRRMIALSPSACLVLRQHRDNEEALKESLQDDGLIFCHVDGSPLLPDTVTHAWVKLVRRCGQGGIRLHDCRHTHASIMLKQGVHPKIVQERLGHSSIRLTLDTYSHVAPGLQEAAALAFDNVVLASSKERQPEPIR
ncbi:MAG: hypothetical protein A2147_00480 [Chloroflexi bacterium RBG_16_57_8]|nr:MAG: hypothetical protein A2147_00480 [Chloroflexi bacterium RBG_16_57_8]